jgi:hypothetical protein
MSQRPLPPLEVGKAYVATDFESFEYCSASLTGSSAILRLHLKNGTTLDLPAPDDELQNLLVCLCDAYGQTAVEHLRERGWA